MKVLVVGGSGFIGSYIAKELLLHGDQVRIFAKSASDQVQHWLEGASFEYGDIYTIDDSRYLGLLTGCQAVVFAAGVDDRKIERRPAYPNFEKGNVSSSVRLVQLAQQIGIEDFLFIGSYFTFFNEKFPELELQETHPYIRSRVEQKKQVFANLSTNASCTFLELPFVFGEVKGGESLWSPLIKYLKSPWPIFAPSGGTAVVSVVQVGKMAHEILASKAGKKSVQLMQANMHWSEMFLSLTKPLGFQRKVNKLPKSILYIALSLVHIYHNIRGLEGGLNFKQLGKLISKELFLPDDYRGSNQNQARVELEDAFLKTLKTKSNSS